MTTTDTGPVVGESRWKNVALGLLAWAVGLVFFFPVFWMVLNGFKTEAEANTTPKLVFDPTLEQYRTVTSSDQGCWASTRRSPTPHGSWGCRRSS